MNATQPKAVVERFRHGRIIVATGAQRVMPWSPEPPEAAGADLWPAARKARILSYWSWKATAANAASETNENEAEESRTRPDLFALMAQWKEEDDEKDRAYIREFRSELREIRGQDT